MHASCESPWHSLAKRHLLRACFPRMAPFRSMLLTLRGGPESLAPRAHQIPVYLMVFSTFLCRAFTAHEALLARQASVQDKLDTTNAWDLDSRLELAMDALRCPPGDTPIAVLSGGERRRVALCRLLLKEPDILLLDEPTNHLDAESVAWLEKHLQQYKGTVIAVTHDRYFMDNVAGWILELDHGSGIPWKGNYSSWLEQKQQRLIQEERAESQRKKSLDRELEWVRMSPRARQAKGKARLAAYEELVAEEQERDPRADPNEIHI